MGAEEDLVAAIVAERGGKPSKAKHAGGRPTKYDASVHLAAVEGTSKSGATWTHIAEACGVSESTVRLWAAEHEEFSASVTRAKSSADDFVVNALYRRALGSHLVPPDTKACTVWLGNRRPHEWRETARVEVTGANGGPIAHADATQDKLEAYAAEAVALAAAAFAAGAQGGGTDSDA